MKKPDKTRTAGPAANAPDETPLMLKKNAAAPGVIAHTDTGPGDGATIPAPAVEIGPVGSTLLGDGTGQSPAAEPKAVAGLPEAAPDAARSGAATDAAPDAPAAAVPDAVTDAAAGKGPSASDSAPPAAATVSSASPALRVQKTGFWPVVLGGVVAAALGSAATLWVLPHLPAGWLPQDPANANRPAEAAAVDVAAIRAEAVSAAEAAADSRIESLRAELTASTPSANAGDLDAIRRQLDEQEARIRDLAARPQIDPDLAGRVQALADQASGVEQQIRAAGQAAQAQMQAAQAEAQRLQQAAADGTRRAEAVAAVAALQGALDQGIAPDEARHVLEGAGLQPPEALTRPVPSLDSLRSSFPEAARAALRAAMQAQSAAGNGSLIGNFLRAQTGARSVEPRPGSDPDAILSRADDAVKQGRIAAALAEIEALPDPARAAPAMADWLALARAYRDAEAALSDLSAPAN